MDDGRSRPAKALSGRSKNKRKKRPMRRVLPSATVTLGRSTTALLTAALLSGCGATTHAIANREPVAEGLSYQSQYRSEAQQQLAHFADSSSALNAMRCKGDDRQASVAGEMFQDEELLSQGDLLDVSVGDDDTFSGSYEVSQDGTLKLPHLSPVPAHGQTVTSVEAAINAALISGGLYHASPRVSVRVTDFAPARVFVGGAVFEPGSVTVGGASGKDIDPARQQARGATAEGRRLSRALQSAAGIRPDADLSHIAIKRGGRTITVDARPAVDGQPYNDLLLLEGDRIEVPSRGCFQEALMVPSPVTAPGVTVFMSNLTQPAAANANSAIGKEARELRYGTRFMQAVVGMNCVGGAQLTSADRSAVLFTHNPITGASIVVERRIEDLLGRADRDNFDPYILPGDAIACYDSAQTNVFELARGFGIVAATVAVTTAVIP